MADVLTSNYIYNHSMADILNAKLRPWKKEILSIAWPTFWLQTISMTTVWPMFWPKKLRPWNKEFLFIAWPTFWLLSLWPQCGRCFETKIFGQEHKVIFRSMADVWPTFWTKKTSAMKWSILVRSMADVFQQKSSANNEMEISWHSMADVLKQKNC